MVYFLKNTYKYKNYHLSGSQNRHIINIFPEKWQLFFVFLWVPERSGNLCGPNARLPFSLQTFVRPCRTKRFVSPIKTEKYETRIQTFRRCAHRTGHPRRHRRRRPHFALLHPRDGKRPHALALQTGGYSRGHRNRTTGASTPGPRHAIRTDPPRRRPREAGRRGLLRFGTAPVPAASRTHPAEHHAAHERRGDPDSRLCRQDQRPAYQSSRHAQNHPGHARIGQDGRQDRRR